MESVVITTTKPQTLPPVLDACCGSRMFWFNRLDPRAIFIDNRHESHQLPDSSSNGGSRSLTIAPDLVADFTNLPFPDNSFHLVIFDPPHFTRNGSSSWINKKYGTLPSNWQPLIRQGFSECFRVLIPLSTLIFKWNEDDIPLQSIIHLSPHPPLIGNKYGKSLKSHFLVFLKPPNPNP